MDFLYWLPGLIVFIGLPMYFCVKEAPSNEEVEEFRKTRAEREAKMTDGEKWYSTNFPQ